MAILDNLTRYKASKCDSPVKERSIRDHGDITQGCI